MKKIRSAQEQTVVMQQVRAARQLQQHRPKVEESGKAYSRAKQKRHWQKDQEALCYCVGGNL